MSSYTTKQAKRIKDPGGSAVGAFLLAVVAARLEDAGKTRAELSRAAAASGRRGFTEAALSRLWDGIAATPRDGWDYFADACAEFLGVHPLDLWRQAIRAWDADRINR